MAFRSTVPQERPEYDLSNDLHEEVAADVVTESGAAGTTVSVVAASFIAANTEPSFRGAIRGMSGYGMRSMSGRASRTQAMPLWSNDKRVSCQIDPRALPRQPLSRACSMMVAGAGATSAITPIQKRNYVVDQKSSIGRIEECRQSSAMQIKANEIRT